jgi:glycosyltransferase involved in cell wall biosynthesis
LEDSARGKAAYVFSTLRAAITSRAFDLVLCAHINLLPLANFVGQIKNCPVVPLLYGVEAWTPTAKARINSACRRVQQSISIRAYTAERFCAWTGANPKRWHYLPNCIDTSKFFPAPPDPVLIDRYGLAGRTIIMTTGRLANAPNELRKGFDEVIETLPELSRSVPDITYLIVGDGPDRGRLEMKAKELGVESRVVFTGRISDEEKAAHYRLADVFAMPGSNPLFDRYPLRFVFLEAMACGIPVVGCIPDGKGEQTSPEGKLIIQVDPNDKESILKGILSGLGMRGPEVSERVAAFGVSAHRERVASIIPRLISRS